MNERIRELAVEAGITTNLDTNYFIKRDINDIDKWVYYFTEKFAELIIKECSGVNYHSSFQDGEFHARELLEHFGVE